MSERRRRNVVLSRSAARDLENIAAYLAQWGSDAIAGKWVSDVIDSLARLETFPERGSIVREFERFRRKQYRQWVYGKYRIFYRVDDDQVLVFLIADGRRDMIALLRERLLDADSRA